MQIRYPSLLSKSFVLLLSVFIFACSSSVKKEPGKSFQDGRFEVTPFYGEYEVRRTVLKNGLRVLIVSDQKSPTFAIQTWFRVGSKDEVKGKTGLAHLFEHMMFKGTKGYPDGHFDATLEKAGGEGMNAFTSNDQTVYLQELPRDQLGLILDLESERMVNLVVNQKAFETEREVVQNERRFRKENSPEGTLYQLLFETAFLEHPYHWPVIGYEEDLNSMSAADAQDFYQRFYAPDRATLVLVGDVDPSNALNQIEKRYGKFTPRNIPEVVATPEPIQTAQRRKKLSLNIQNDKIWMAYKVPGMDSEISPTIEAIQAVLSDGMNSRLNRALVDSGIASNISAGSFGMKDPGLFVIGADLQKGKTAALAETVILRELDRLKKSLVPEAELNRAKNVYQFQFLSQLNKGSGIAYFLGNAESHFGHFRRGMEQRDQVLQTSPQMLQSVANQIFKSSQLTVMIGVPKK